MYDINTIIALNSKPHHHSKANADVALPELKPKPDIRVQVPPTDPEVVIGGGGTIVLPESSKAAQFFADYTTNNPGVANVGWHPRHVLSFESRTALLGFYHAARRAGLTVDFEQGGCSEGLDVSELTEIAKIRNVALAEADGVCAQAEASLISEQVAPEQSVSEQSAPEHKQASSETPNPGSGRSDNDTLTILASLIVEKGPSFYARLHDRVESLLKALHAGPTPEAFVESLKASGILDESQAEGLTEALNAYIGPSVESQEKEEVALA